MQRLCGGRACLAGRGWRIRSGFVRCFACSLRSLNLRGLAVGIGEGEIYFFDLQIERAHAEGGVRASAWSFCCGSVASAVSCRIHEPLHAGKLNDQLLHAEASSRARPLVAGGGIRGRVWVRRVASILRGGRRGRPCLRGGELRQLFQLERQRSECQGIEIVDNAGDAVQLLDLLRTQAERHERLIQSRKLLLDGQRALSGWSASRSTNSRGCGCRWTRRIRGVGRSSRSCRGCLRLRCRRRDQRQCERSGRRRIQDSRRREQRRRSGGLVGWRRVLRQQKLSGCREKRELSDTKKARLLCCALASLGGRRELVLSSGLRPLVSAVTCHSLRVLRVLTLRIVLIQKAFRKLNDANSSHIPPYTSSERDENPAPPPKSGEGRAAQTLIRRLKSFSGRIGQSAKNFRGILEIQ